MTLNGDTLFVWQEHEPDSDKWGVIVMVIPFLDSQAGPLMHRSEAIAREHFGPLAHAHGVTAQRAVRLARFELADVLDAH